MFATKNSKVKPQRSLLSILTLSFLILSLTALIISGSIQLFFNIRTQQLAIEKNQQLIAQEAAKTVSNFITEKISVLKATIWLTTPYSYDKIKQKSFLQSLLGLYPSFLQALLFDDHNEIAMRVSRRSFIASVRAGVMYKDEALRVIRHKDYYISPVYIDEITNEPLILLAVPIVDLSGVYQGTLMAEMNLKFMWDLLTRIQHGAAGYAYVVDRVGNLISCNDESRVLRNENVRHITPVNDFIKNSNPMHSINVYIFKGLNQSFVVGSYVPLGTPEWAVIIELPWVEAYQDIIREIIIGIGIIILMVFLVGKLSVRLAKQISIPIVGLMKTAVQIAQGERDLRADVRGPQEVQSLAEAFNSMTAQLIKSYQQLEQKTVELDLYFNRSLDLLCIADMDGKFLRLNKEWESTLGYDIDELLNHNLIYYVHPEDIPETQAKLSQLGKQQEVLNFVNRYRCKDGSYRWIEWRSSPVGDRIYSAARDITDRKLAEAAQKKSEEQYKTLFEQANDAIIIMTQDEEIILKANIRALEMYGFTREEFIGMSMKKISHDFESCEAQIARTLEQGFIRNIECIHYRKDGTQLNVLVNASVIEFNDKQVILSINRDITERKKVEETMQLLAHTMESISEIANITDLNDRITFVNEAFLHIYGYQRSEIIGQHISKVWSPNNKDGLIEEVIRQSRIGSWKGEILNMTKDGREFPLSLHTSQVRDEQGNIIGLVGISEDISTLKNLEAQLLQSQKMEAIGRLAGGVAHDFNNMIAIILGYASLIEEELIDSDPLKQHVTAIISAAERSANLTKQLLAFARKQVIAPVVLNLNDSLSTLSHMLTRLIGEDISLTLKLAEYLWNVKIDPIQVDQILTNLSTNARDAIENVGTIIIETSNTIIEKEYAQDHVDVIPGEYVQLSFSDDGKGMDKATLNRVFEPFFTTKLKGSGTGLGLATIFGIVKQNNGFISVYSELHHGTLFKIFLPRFYGQAEKKVKQTASKLHRGTETVLVVEDEEGLLNLAKMTLEMYGYKVITAESPGDAILTYEQYHQQIHLLITDVVMPGMNGKELYDRLSLIQPGLRVIYMSGYTADIVTERGILEEGMQFIQKPFKPMDLVAKVQQVLKK
jgi:two-component system, cell cycle sensor histidine kinase and response regulator CckA